LRWSGIDLKAGLVARKGPSGLVLDPGGEQLDVQRAYTVPRLVGPGTEGVPADEEGFIRADDDGLVEGCERTWAAGDGVVSPLKFGGLATHQARRAAAAIARVAGAAVPDQGEAVVHGQLLVGHRRRRLRSGDDEGAPLWWQQGKVAGEYLPRWLVEHGIAPPPSAEKPQGGVTVSRSLRALRGAEAQHLFDLSRRLDSRDPAVAALGRRMRELRDR
jgi:sulfide:quinone oxidoreductase